MKTFQIKGTARLAVGKKSNKALRVQDLVPCVIYGGDKVVHFQAHENEFRKLIYTPKVYQTEITVDGVVYNAFMQALQFHPVTDKLLHIDFLEIRENVPVKIQIPVRLDGYAKGIQQGGRLKSNLRTLKAKGFPKDFPDAELLKLKHYLVDFSFNESQLKSENFILFVADVFRCGYPLNRFLNYTVDEINS